MTSAGRLRIVQVNAAYDPAIETAADLLDAYPTLCQWGDALAEAGATVATIQRFHTARRETRGAVSYAFVRDSAPPLLPWWRSSREVCEAVRSCRPNVVHVNGLQFPALVGALRSTLGSAVIVVQDHAGQPPPHGRTIGRLRRWFWRRGLSVADAHSFTSAEQALPWRDAGLLRDTPLLEMLEASTRIRPLSRAGTRARTGVRGRPAILWVGRLTANKDPMTVLTGLERALPSLPEAHAYFVYADGDLESLVRARVDTSTVLCDRVTLVGAVSHASIAEYYSAADIFVSGSHREGSGYALIEALACGLLPVVTSIPSFRAIAGSEGCFWIPGDAGSFAAALRGVASEAIAEAGSTARQRRFERELSWPAIAARTLDAYERLVLRSPVAP